MTETTTFLISLLGEEQMNLFEEWKKQRKAASYVKYNEKNKEYRCNYYKSKNSETFHCETCNKSFKITSNITHYDSEYHKKRLPQ